MYREIKLFLSSAFDEGMQEQRDKINSELNLIVGKTGEYLFHHDYESATSTGGADFFNILDKNFQQIDESDYFIGIVGGYYGEYINNRLVQSYTGKFKELTDKGIRKKLSPLELEFIKSLKNTNQKKLFFIQNTIPDCSTGIKKLIARVEKKTTNSNIESPTKSPF